jgi:ubiquitin carboxyl-terminal hydrolase 4/11/15
LLTLKPGFYKNTMVCPNCDKVSITFDPYSQLTLQLPIEQTWAHTVTYIPLLGKGKPCLVEVDMDKNATIKALKEFVGKRFGGVPASRLMASEVYSNKFYRHLEDNVSIAEANIGQRDDIYVYELDNAPSNWPPPKKKGSRYRGIHASSDEEIPDNASPLHDRVLIPVFNRGPSSYRPSSHTLTLWPFFIVLTRDEAKDYDIILQKILARVAQMTTRDIFGELSDPILGQSNPGSDVVLTTDEDALPNGEVKDGSIEGEDLVEVTMADSNGVFPKVLEPGAFIHAELRRLFEVKHTRKAKETVTTGWNTVDPNRPLEPISKRMPVPSTDVSENDEDSSEEDGITSQSMNASPKLPSIASSDEEMQSVEPEDTAATRGGRPKKKSKKALKKERRRERTLKGNKNFRSNKTRVSVQPSYSEDPDDDDDDSLIRMGEALVLEWPTDTFDALFGGNSVDDARGQDALKFIETLEDPEIGEKKARRAARKKHGITLDSCFSETAKSEVLSEDNAWYCGRCKELRRATKTLEIWSVPDILIIHLKRFSGTRSMRDKIDEFVNFPVKGLDLAGKVGYPDGKDLKYDLFAVDNHMGGLGGGHYTAYAQNFFDDQWYEYNGKLFV